MITRIPSTIINELISRTNIVELISRRISLKKQGKNFLARCPFHIETHPSFTVNIEKQFYYCFSCGSHGNAIDFLMNYDRLTFVESIKELSIINGISLELNVDILKENNHQKTNLYQLMNKLSQYYQNILIQRKYLYAYKYLQNRGLNAKTIADFNIGFAPPGWDNIVQKFSFTSYDQTLLDQSGMLISNNKKYKYDRFRNRLMFPIRDIAGRIVAFGGRVITHKKMPKYLNSPDTEIFKKNQHLYGLYETRIQHKNPSHILLVEGYIDVITLTQFGINYAVASLGTTTANHIRLLYNITNQIICCYDGDHAGKKAAWRTLNIVLPYLTDDRQINFIFLPHGEDPDTLIRKIGKNNFLKILTQKQDLSNFLFKTLSQKINLQTLEGRVKLSSLILPMLNKIPGKTLKLCLLQQLGNKIGILDENKLNQLLIKKPILSTNKTRKYCISYGIEHILIGLLIQNPHLAKLVPNIQELKQFKKDDVMILIFTDLVKICKTCPAPTPAQLLEHYRENKFFSKLETLAYWNHLITNDMIETTFIDALTKLYNLTLEQRQEMLIARDRISRLTTQERQELWLLTQTLSKR
ncbi:DNA primase [Candidatus Blochmannia vicinus (nom. nud.)]|uniref:DNA primase n=1 Tax=Candidatus Blochmannia vicinus (nom. nud.) TaxID=251540 RepID=UPI0020241FCC|nr:DNA primase [Candidatus Blochmannia vicinus]URJ30848.1 DNA primase [Candidatus Blochmannia vicinus]